MPKLKTETDTPDMDKRISAAFNVSDEWESHARKDCYADTTFEHGQWFVACVCGAAWSAVDAEPGIDGFAFEQLSEGDLE